jgi:hypothetical protein
MNSGRLCHITAASASFRLKVRAEPLELYFPVPFPSKDLEVVLTHSA